MKNAKPGFQGSPTPFYRKIQRQQSKMFTAGNAAQRKNSQAKMKNLIWRYRAKVAAQQPGQSGFDSALIQRKLKKHEGVNQKARRRTLRPARNLNSSPPPGTPGGTY
jgi:hypothetical protein